jgi:hypothetical protein
MKYTLTTDITVDATTLFPGEKYVKSSVRYTLFKEISMPIAHSVIENMERERLEEIILQSLDMDQILEFLDDDSAKLWFILEYGG